MSGPPEGTAHRGNRFRASIRVEVQDGGRTTVCEAQNISRSGVLVAGDFKEPPANAVALTLSAPGGGTPVHLSGRVIRVQQGAGPGGLRIALQFVDMDDSKHDAVEVLLARLLETHPAGSLESLTPGSTPQQIKKALEAIPLPQRIALSARAGVKDREFLRLDTHSAVLEALVRNPGFSVIEARALAASPHLMPGTLDALANDPRFKEDEEVRFAVAVHPRVSPATAERVTADFKVPQIRKLLARPGLNQSLREKLVRKTTQR